MSRSGSLLARALPLAIALLGFSPARAGEIHVALHASAVAGDGFSGGTVQVVLKDALGALKGVATESISGGSWWLSFGSSPAPVTVGAGDSVTVLVDGASVGAMGVPGIAADTNPANDVTSGRVTAGPGAALPAEVELDLHTSHLVGAPAPGREEVYTDATVPLAADGRFVKAWGVAPGAHDIRRNDEVTVRLHVTGANGHVWNFTLDAPVTGLTIFEGIDAVRVQGPVTSVCTLDLTARRRLKARTAVTLLEPGRGLAHFTRGGWQVPITAGLAVRLKGPGGHQVRIPALSGAVDAAADSVAGTTLPNAVVEASLTHDEHDSPARVCALSDGLGSFAITFPEDVVPGDLVEVRIQQPDGTWIVRRLPVAAAP